MNAEQIAELRGQDASVKMRLWPALIVTSLVGGIGYMAIGYNTADAQELVGRSNQSFVLTALLGAIISFVFALLGLPPIYWALRRLQILTAVAFIPIGFAAWFVYSMAFLLMLGGGWGSNIDAGVSMLPVGAAVVAAFWLVRTRFQNGASNAATPPKINEGWAYIRPLVYGLAASAVTFAVCAILAQAMFATVAPSWIGNYGMNIYLGWATLMLLVPGFVAGLFAKRYGALYGVILAGIPILLFSLENKGVPSAFYLTWLAIAAVGGQVGQVAAMRRRDSSQS